MAHDVVSLIFDAQIKDFAALSKPAHGGKLTYFLQMKHIFHTGDQADAMVAKHVCAQNAEQSSSFPDNVVQEKPLFSLEVRGKAMAMEKMCKENISQTSISPDVVQGELNVFLSCGNDDQHIQKVPVVNIESFDTMDVDGAGRQPDAVDPLNCAPMVEPDIAPTVGAYTVQCAKCMKWRFIPTKEQYEVIRQSIVEKPFLCSSAAAWRPNASCRDALEISPELHELWAVDRPSIPLAPAGWERLLVIRPQGSSKFADIYYVTPSGRKLRSTPEIVRYLEEHPEYSRAGLKLSQFSFLSPKPLDKDYSKKKNERLPCDQRGNLLHKKSYSKKFAAELYPKKAGGVQSLFKGTVSKPKLEKLKCRKKAVSLDGEMQAFQPKDQSGNSSDCKKAMENSSLSEEPGEKAVWNCVQKSGEIVNGCVMSMDQLPMSSRREVQGAACHVK